MVSDDAYLPIRAFPNTDIGRVKVAGHLDKAEDFLYYIIHTSDTLSQAHCVALRHSVISSACIETSHRRRHGFLLNDFEIRRPREQGLFPKLLQIDRSEACSHGKMFLDYEEARTRE
jgi:hypothetical protein